jgi:hypothetical protein
MPGTDAHFTEEAKDRISATMHDPDAAQFRSLRVVRVGDERALCGEVNGKNRFGAYVGFTRFAVVPDATFVDPGYSDLHLKIKDAERECQQVQSVLGPGRRSFSCKRLDELDRQMIEQSGFEGGWRAVCGSASRAT